LAAGSKSRHVAAFTRGGRVVAAAPRLVLGLAGDWGDTSLQLPPGDWFNELTGESVAGGAVRLADLLRRFPVALLSQKAQS